MMLSLLLGIYQDKWKICPYKDLYTNVYSSFIFNCVKHKATQTSIIRGMNKQTVVYTGILRINKKEWAAGSWNMSESQNNYAKWKKSDKSK